MSELRPDAEMSLVDSQNDEDVMDSAIEQKMAFWVNDSLEEIKNSGDVWNMAANAIFYLDLNNLKEETREKIAFRLRYYGCKVEELRTPDSNLTESAKNAF